jgi:hypothetical protein
MQNISDDLSKVLKTALGACSQSLAWGISKCHKDPQLDIQSPDRNFGSSTSRIRSKIGNNYTNYI